MDDNRTSDKSVKNGGTAAGDKRSYDKGNQCDRKSAFESPVIRSMGFVGFRDFDGIVDCTLDYLYIETIRINFEGVGM